uniref:Uncharacterized protein n=1 Tax=Leersia perrieri TaxID=77586 RepID=A0A0D9Y1K8_9ORYZ
MDAQIWSLCSSLTAVLAHAEDSSRDLSDVLSRRPMLLGNPPRFDSPFLLKLGFCEISPLKFDFDFARHAETAASAFLQGLERRVEAAGPDLSRLESMAFGTVSFEELLGHCGEALAICSRHADAVERRLVSYGYVPPEVEASKSEDLEGDGDEEKLLGSVLRSNATLATLSSQDDDLSGRAEILFRKPESVADVRKNMMEAEPALPPKETNCQGDAQGMIKTSKEEFEKLPPYLKTLASWEELQEAISELNSYFGSDKAQGSLALNQDDVGAIVSGRKGRSFLLILLRLNQLTMENIDGSIFYNVRKNDS